jgi:hypothetical protein
MGGEVIPMIDYMGEDDLGEVEVAFETLPDNITLFHVNDAPDVLVEALALASPLFAAAPEGWVFWVPQRIFDQHEGLPKRWSFQPPPTVVVNLDGAHYIGWIPDLDP